MKKIIALTLIATLTACATVRQVDVNAWVGQPVIALESHPFFITIPPVKSQLSDGSEIWNYVNGGNLSSCTGGGDVYGRKLNSTQYSQFASCLQRFAACNNIFYIRDGKVTQYTPVGTGGMRCYTDESLQPNFRGATNVR